MKGLLALLLLVACRSDSPRFSDCHVAADLSGPPMTVPDAATVDASATLRAASPNGCDGFVASPIPPSTHWVDTQVATGTCASPPPVAPDVCATAAEMYASCESHITSPRACALELGMQFCYGGRWTVLCEHDSECPEGFACAFPGSTDSNCERRCHVSSDCGVCDLVCTPDGYCGPPPPPPFPDAGLAPPDASPISRSTESSPG